VSPAPRTLLVHGWRGIPHSYAVVNQWTLLALRHRPGLSVHVRDARYFREAWTPLTGLFSVEEEAYLNSLPVAPEGPCDAEFRICYPAAYGDLLHRRTAVFGTSEYKVIKPGDLQSAVDFQSARQREDVLVVTPSRWSAEGFLRHGFPEERILVVPHGVDATRFLPNPDQRLALKEWFGVQGFVFLSIGAMTGNKGMSFLLRAFAVVAKQRPDVHLFLKGSDHLYPSGHMLNQLLEALTPAEQAAIQGRFTYHGTPLSMDDMASLYQLADAYVSPYRAEGFNMPVLEAAACGLPVICTRGGATDDFVEDSFAKRIDSRKVSFDLDGLSAERLDPDFDHLITHMLAVVDDESWRKAASVAAAQHVHQNYTWEKVTETLLDGLFDR
jgi:glycosyltransferase involved in cell wall biosynthesis